MCCHMHVLPYACVAICMCSCHSYVELRLLSNYLSDRVQYVEYLGAISQSRSIGVGVPQGSILGPLLFLIYINDLPKSSDMFNILMYADDTTVFCNFDTQGPHSFSFLN